MHPLHHYLAAQLVEKLKTRKIVVWYDERREFGPFVEELRGCPRAPGSAVLVTIDGLATQLIEFAGSLFELRVAAEPYVHGDEAKPVLLYLLGQGRDRQGSVLMELEKAGECYEPQLKRQARNVLRHRYSDGVIDELLAPEKVSYEDLARASSAASAEPPSMLKSVFHDTVGNDALLAAWLASDARDADLEAKQATTELTKLVRSRLGLELPETASLSKLRALTLRYLLVGEFRSDLGGQPPASLDAVPAPKTKDEERAVRELAKVLRSHHAEAYPGIADRLEDELGLRQAKIPADALGSIDTFRFEEQTLLSLCGELIASGSFDRAFQLVTERGHSFWLEREPGRKLQWEACRQMAELGALASSVRAAVGKVEGGPGAWVDAYTGPDGWYRLDQAQRRLETLLAQLEDEPPEERPLGIVRRAYEDTCRGMAEGFTKALVKADWVVSTSLHQTRIYGEVVAQQPRPTAYFLVDAMRFEMGMELAERLRLRKNAEVGLRHAIGALPTITTVGMAALQPGASSSFGVVEADGRLGGLIEDAFLPDLKSRKKFAASRVPQLVDLELDDLLSLKPSKLAERLEGKQLIVVRSQEIDHAGEAGFPVNARRVMDMVIDDLVRAISKLARAGVEHSVVTADHGHLFFATDRDESMRTDSPGGEQFELHRRCWIGRGGATPAGCVRVSAAALGSASDLDFVFPAGCGVFKSGGDLAYHHGGPSLQELVIPVINVRLKARVAASPTAGPVTAVGLPEVVTNRIFSVTMLLSEQGRLFSSQERIVRPLLLAAKKQAGAVGMVSGAEFDRTTGCVTLQPGKPATVVFLVSDESCASLRVVILDPSTDAELYRSPADIPVRFGV